MNYFLDPLKKKYADFSGRARRKEFWMFYLFYLIFAVVASILDTILKSPMIISCLFSLALLIPSLALTVRRLHDVDKSGWWIFISLIPLVGSIWLLVLLCTPGIVGPNQFGSDPKEEIEIDIKIEG